MLDITNTTKALDKFANKVVIDAKANLKSKQKYASGKLFESIKNNGSKTSKRSIELRIRMAQYGAYIDKGVSGVKVKYNTPYSYTNKMPPPSKLDGWIVRKGIAPRTKTGQFMSRKSVQFAIAKSIFNKGIKPSHFFTDAVSKNLKVLPEWLRVSFAFDVENTVKYIIKTNFKK